MVYVSDHSEVHLVVALMRRKLLRQAELDAMLTPSLVGNYGLGIVVVGSGCAGTAYQHGGASYGSAADVFISDDGSRVAALLANGNTPAARGLLPRGSSAVFDPANRLYCGA
jgi:hypothetical protein